MIKKVLLVTVCLIAGVIFGLYLEGVSITTMLSGVPEPLQSAVSQVQVAWASIPQSLQGITLAAVPTAFMMFFAWSKTRAMQKLEQVKQTATTQLGELQGANAEAQTEISSYQTALTAKQNEIKSLQAQLANTSKEGYATLQQNYTRLQDDFTKMEAHYINEIAELKLKTQVIVK